MPFPIRCTCGMTYSAIDKIVGKHIKCPSCGSIIRVEVPKLANAPQPDGQDYGFVEPEVETTAAPPALPDSPQRLNDRASLDREVEMLRKLAANKTRETKSLKAHSELHSARAGELYDEYFRPLGGGKGACLHRRQRGDRS